MNEYFEPNQSQNPIATHQEQIPVNATAAPYKEPYLPNEEGHSKKAPASAGKKKGAWKIVTLALCVSLVSSIAGTSGVLLLNNHIERQEAEKTAAEAESARQNEIYVLKGQREKASVEMVEIETGKQMTASEVYAANVNSTVGITTSVTTNYWGFQSTSAASGSGFIISSDGYILTNYHVVEDSDSISVSMYDGTVYDGELIGYDESNDIAVLKVEAEGLVPVVLGDSDNLNVGDSVVAIGNPLGELTFSLTAGTISAKDREVTLSSTVTMNLLQTDCAINSGNSGGALFNMYGEVIGITNAKYSSNSSSGASIDNIGFAIPLNSVWRIIESIIENGYIVKPYLGITVSNVSKEAQNFGIPQGAAVQAVAEESPAENAGLCAGDVITQVNETPITSSRELVSYISAAAVGDNIELSVYRQGSSVQIVVEVGEQVQSARKNEESEQEESEVEQGQSKFPQGNRPFGGRG